MSSILKALKKVETGAAGAPPESPWMRKMDAGRSFQEALQEFWLLRRPVLVFFFLLAAVGGVGFFLLEQRALGPDEGHRPVRVPGDGSPGNPQAGTEKKTRLPGERGLGIDAASLDKPPGGKNLPPPSPPVDRPLSALAEKGPPPTAVVETAGTRSEAVPSLGPETASTRAVSTAIQIVSSPALSLQAISWSETASRSIAVLNNQVVHETEAINGYVVRKIQPDNVLLEKDGQTYSLVFSQ